MKFSVIMPAFNEEKHIGKTLEAIVAQTFSSDAFEVIVVDNGSSDATVNIAKSYASRLHVNVISSIGGNIASVRNAGAKIATGEIVVFLDSDCVPKTTWLEDALKLRPENSIWGAHYLAPPDATWVGSVWGTFQASQHEGPTTFIPSSNAFIARKDFEALGGFGESQDTSEDVELSHRARQRGMQIVAIPQLAVVHLGTPTKLQQFYRQNYWHGKHVLRMFLAHLPSLDNLPIVALSFYFLIMLLASVIVPLIVIPLHHGILAPVPAILLLLPATLLTLWKSVRRGQFNDAPSLWVLYMTYLFARAAALASAPSRSHR